MSTNTPAVTLYSLHPAETSFWKSTDPNCCIVKIAKSVIGIVVIPLELVGRLFINLGIAIYNLFQKTTGTEPSELKTKAEPLVDQPHKASSSNHISQTALLILKAQENASSKSLSKEVCILKLRGTLYGQAVGDGLGMFTEFLSTTEAQKLKVPLLEFADRSKFSRPHVNRFPIDGWTDDTDQMILIGCAEQESQLDPTVPKERRMAQQLINWVKHGLNGFSSVEKHSFHSRQDASSSDSYRKKIGCQGLGSLTSQVLRHCAFLEDPHAAALDIWKDKNGPIKTRLAANGALMRTSILGVIYKNNLNQAVLEAIRYAKVTHADPRCIASSVALTVAIVLLHAGIAPADALSSAENIAVSVLFDEMHAIKEHLNSKESQEWEEIAKDFEKELRECMHDSLDGLKLDEKGKIGYTFKSLGAAFYAMREAMRLMSEDSSSPEKVFRTVIQEIIFQGGDADTNAAPAAALVGAYLGETAIPASWKNGLHSQDKIVLEEALAYAEEIAQTVS